MIGAKLKIALLYDVWNEDPVAAAAREDAPSAPKARKKNKKTKKVEKTDREEIFEALQRLGHEPSYFELDGRPTSLHSLSRCDADLIFNLTESFDGDDTKEMNVVAYVDLLGLRYTGAGPHSILLAQDKAIAKKIFAFHGIKTPFFATAYRGRIEHAHDISFPLIVKPAWEDGSIGIDAGSVVKNIKEMMERVQYIQDEFDSPALIEEYIEGREIYAGILGSYETAQVLPLVELDLSRLPEGTPKIASYDVKFEKNTEVYKLTKSQVAEDLNEETVKQLSDTALAAYRALKLRDYGRIDMRLAPNGDVYVIEANPNPWLASRQEFAMAGRASGRSYTELIGEIVELAMSRYPSAGLANAAATH
ncbi:MAG: ATP-grasp domain-containing protein [Acidobacteriales bacterium]|nr:ATP-grasp domain-containing protein [Candidatus Koribacter versatilis]MBI3644999.1 ATP-grasp domain-containing protein [Terriglobales bacterium]